eukprot:3353101-Pleurochrysis_carterae.AAC.1
MCAGAHPPPDLPAPPPARALGPRVGAQRRRAQRPWPDREACRGRGGGRRGRPPRLRDRGCP